MSEPSMVSFGELELGFGYELSLIPDLNNKQQAFDCVLAGCIPQECLMVTAPESGLFPRVECGLRVLVRIRLPSGVALFPTTILFISETPTLIVYLYYPRDIKFKRVRAARVAISLPVLVNNKNDENIFAVGCKVVDISTSGARIESTESIGNSGDVIEVKGKFLVGNIARMVAVKCVIRAERPRLSYGVEFVEEDEDKLLVLLGFIFQSLAFNNAQAVV
jgi:PilZ domain